jgi:hypothetical protein
MSYICPSISVFDSIAAKLPILKLDWVLQGQSRKLIGRKTISEGRSKQRPYRATKSAGFRRYTRPRHINTQKLLPC